jgi:DNA invertase Pin-like site-specific DNA recombinase
MASVRVIPATIAKASAQGVTGAGKRRVAAYARVSTDSEEQLTSYEAQVDYYTKYIKSRADWEFACVYTDEGISAVNTKRRDGFKRMVADALAGKIDLIVTKSVSRFARNTVDSLQTVRSLKERNVEVYFEKENIYTFDGKGELLITIMSSLAQEESRSISENVTWGQRKRFADGKVTMPYAQFLGYEKGEDGQPKIVENEAETVRGIFRLFIGGMTYSAIAKRLTADGIPTPGGKTVWQTATVRSILQNEKYKGDALLQKCFTVDFLTKKQKVNEGEVPQYYVENSHPAIIAPDEFDAVQAEIERRAGRGRPSRCDSPFSGKLVCGECGGTFGSKVWHSTDEYRRTVWRCNEKYKGEGKCATPHVTEDAVKDAFIKAMNGVLDGRDELLSDCRMARDLLTDTKIIDAELATLHQEIEVACELSRKAIAENARAALDQDEFAKRYDALVARHDKATARATELETMKRKRQSKHRALSAYIREIESRDTAIDEFDERLWAAAVESVTVGTDGGMTFRFKDCTEIHI